eukprot:jgi/Botrbrau1/8095/Bobra.0230s0020.1
MKGRDLTFNVPRCLCSGSSVRSTMGREIRSVTYSKRLRPEAAVPQKSKESASRSNGQGWRKRSAAPIRTGQQGPSILQEVANQITGVSTAVVKRGRRACSWRGTPSCTAEPLTQLKGRRSSLQANQCCCPTTLAAPFGWGVYNPSSMYRVRCAPLCGPFSMYCIW